MASSKREKELARQRAERQAARRAAAAQRKRQRQAIIASVVAVLLVATAAIAAAMSVGGGDDDPAPVAAPTASAAPTAAASDEPSASAAPTQSAAEPGGDPGCEYVKTEAPAVREVVFPPTEGVELEKLYRVTITTNRGEVVFDMDSAETPCTSNNMRSLAHFKYFDDTPCHRLTTEGISVLQCGSPDGSGNGGPGYSFADENLEGATYERGTVAMANSGPNTNGSQFFLVYEDSSLPPNYTPFGTIVSGLDVLEEIAAAGSDESYGVGDGKPNLSVQIESIRIKEKTA